MLDGYDISIVRTEEQAKGQAKKEVKEQVKGKQMDVENCALRGREHKFFIINDLVGTIEGISNVKLFAVLACTACGHSVLNEHIIDKESAAKLTQSTKIKNEKETL